MKQRYRINYVRLIWMSLLLLVLLTVLFVGLRAACDGKTASEPKTATQEPIFTPEPTPIDLYAYYEWVETVRIPVYDHRADELMEMDLEEYILGVVSAEMPAAYSHEALKAQAVASRTYAVYNIEHGGCHTDPDAAVCTNSACCQAFLDEQRMKERWGSDFVRYRNTVAAAVMETAGEVLMYDGQLIDALYHADSGGHTEDSENVYANAIPYLRGVDSPWDTPSRTDTVTLTATEALSLIQDKYPEAEITRDSLFTELAVLSRYPSGRVAQFQLGKCTLTGKQARALFGLDSAMFTLTIVEDSLVFDTKGYGHGVGMSQNGANGMAQNGSDYRAILAHYYTDTELLAYTGHPESEAATAAPNEGTAGGSAPIFVPNT